jgi:hypothetical protein
MASWRTASWWSGTSNVAIHFRLFLRKLVKANMLNLIPQCKAMPRSGGNYEWTFNSAADRMPARKPKEEIAAATSEAKLS